MAACAAPIWLCCTVAGLLAGCDVADDGTCGTSRATGVHWQALQAEASSGVLLAVIYIVSDPAVPFIQEDEDDVVEERDPSGRFARYDQKVGKGRFKCVYKGFDEKQGIDIAWSKVLQVRRVSWGILHFSCGCACNGTWEMCRVFDEFSRPSLSH